MVPFIWHHLSGTLHHPPYTTLCPDTTTTNSIAYNTIQYNTIQYNTIQYNTILKTTKIFNITALILSTITLLIFSGCEKPKESPDGSSESGIVTSLLNYYGKSKSYIEGEMNTKNHKLIQSASNQATNYYSKVEGEDTTYYTFIFDTNNVVAEARYNQKTDLMSKKASYIDQGIKWVDEAIKLHKNNYYAQVHSKDNDFKCEKREDYKRYVEQEKATINICWEQFAENLGMFIAVEYIGINTQMVGISVYKDNEVN